MISEERVEKSLVYLAESDEDYAYAHAKAKAIEKEEKIVKAQAFINAKRLYDTVAEANAVADSSQEYKDWKERWENSLAGVKLLENKRETEKVIWETWRTEQANLRNT